MDLALLSIFTLVNISLIIVIDDFFSSMRSGYRSGRSIHMMVRSHIQANDCDEAARLLAVQAQILASGKGAQFFHFSFQRLPPQAGVQPPIGPHFSQQTQPGKSLPKWLGLGKGHGGTGAVFVSSSVICRWMAQNISASSENDPNRFVGSFDLTQASKIWAFFSNANDGSVFKWRGILRVLATLVKKIRTVVVSKPISAKTSSASSFGLRSIRACHFTASALIAATFFNLRTIANHSSANLTPTLPFLNHTSS